MANRWLVALTAGLLGLASDPPAVAAAGSADLVVAYVGFQKGAASRSHGDPLDERIHARIHGLLSQGAAAGGDVLTKAALDRKSHVTLNFAAVDRGERINRFKGGDFATFHPSKLLLSFCALDDVVVTATKESGGLISVGAFMMVGCHLFSYKRREVTHSALFVLPLTLKTERADYKQYLLERLDAEEVRKSFPQYLPKVAGVLASGTVFASAIAEAAASAVKGLDEHYTMVGVDSALDGVAMDGERKKRYQDFAAAVLTAKVANDIWMVPPYAALDRALAAERRDAREQGLREIIQANGEPLQILTGYGFDKKDDAPESELDESSKKIVLGRNVFPEAKRQLRLDISAKRRNTRLEGDHQHYRVDVATSARLGVPGDARKMFCPVAGKSHPQASDVYEGDYVTGAAAALSDADIFNRTFVVLNGKLGKIKLVGPEGVYGDDDALDAEAAKTACR